MRTLYFAFLLLLSCNSFSQVREIALTIDDLPLVGSNMNTPGNQERATERFMRILQALTQNDVPATGFVIAGAIGKGQWDFLVKFQEAGFKIGNHSYSHYNLNQMKAEKYIADLAKADSILTPIISEPKYFRYPYLAEGQSQKKQQVLNYLKENNYIVAPVTIDSKDFRFNQELYRVPYRSREKYVYQIKPRYLAYIWDQTLKAEKRAKGMPVKQILIIHANVLNSYLLDDVIKMYKQNGYKFITLSEALENPAPAIQYVPAPSQETESNVMSEIWPFSKESADKMQGELHEQKTGA